MNSGPFGHTGDLHWLEAGHSAARQWQPAGALVVLEDAGYIRTEATDVVAAELLAHRWPLVILIVGVTFLMVRWFLMRPITRLAERLRRLRMGHRERRLGSEVPTT